MRPAARTEDDALCPLCREGKMSSFAADERFETRCCTGCHYLATAFRRGHEARGSYYESVVDEGASEGSVGTVRAEQTELMLDLLAHEG